MGGSMVVVMVFALRMIMRVMMAVLDAVDHRAAAEEEQRLEYGVRDQVEHGGDIGANAHRRHHKAKLRYRRIGQHALDIPLPERDITRHQRGAGADQGDDQCQ